MLYLLHKGHHRQVDGDTLTALPLVVMTGQSTSGSFNIQLSSSFPTSFKEQVVFTILCDWCGSARQAWTLLPFVLETLPGTLTPEREKWVLRDDEVETAITWALVQAKLSVGGTDEVEYVSGQRRDNLRGTVEDWALGQRAAEEQRKLAALAQRKAFDARSASAGA